MAKSTVIESLDLMIELAQDSLNDAMRDLTKSTRRVIEDQQRWLVALEAGKLSYSDSSAQQAQEQDRLRLAIQSQGQHLRNLQGLKRRMESEIA